jgi:hypothetical protein
VTNNFIKIIKMVMWQKKILIKLGSRESHTHTCFKCFCKLSLTSSSTHRNCLASIAQPLVGKLVGDLTPAISLSRYLFMAHTHNNKQSMVVQCSCFFPFSLFSTLALPFLFFLLLLYDQLIKILGGRGERSIFITQFAVI